MRGKSLPSVNDPNHCYSDSSVHGLSELSLKALCTTRPVNSSFILSASFFMPCPLYFQCTQHWLLPVALHTYADWYWIANWRRVLLAVCLQGVVPKIGVMDE